MQTKAKCTVEQQKEIAARFSAGETTASLVEVYGVGQATVREYCKKHGASRAPGFRPPVEELLEFTKRARSILWRHDAGKEKTAYDAWTARVAALESDTGGNYSKNEAIVRASKEFPCLHRLFREYDVSRYDPHPESHPQIRYFGKEPATPIQTGVANEGKDQSYRDSLRWAIDAAGAFLRTGQLPSSCPCDAAWYLFEQAKSEPKDFLAKVGQIESKGDLESSERAAMSRSGQKSVREIEAMLDTLEVECNAKEN